MDSLQPIKRPHAELPHLGFHRYQPHYHLRHWIQSYWTAQQFDLPESGFTETLYPDGGVSLTFSFRNNMPEVALRTRQITSRIFIHTAIDSIGIRFHPGGICKLFSLDMKDLLDADSSLEILRQELDNIHERLAEHSTSTERLLKIEHWLLSKCYRRNLHPGLLQYFVPQFLASNESINELVKRQAISRRQLERKFQQDIGLSPAQLKQLHKIKFARECISLDPQRALTEIALDCGFYDQSHFTHQFQRVTGQTPGHYKNRKLAQQTEKEIRQGK